MGESYEVFYEDGCTKTADLSTIPINNWLLIHIEDELPKVHETIDSGAYPKFSETSWENIAKDKSTRQIGIFTKIMALQNARAMITNGLSCEQVVEDIAAELYLMPKLKALSQFRHLFILDDKNNLVIYVNNVANESERSIRFRGVLYFPKPQDDKVPAPAANVFALALKEAAANPDTKISNGELVAATLLEHLSDLVRVDIPDFVFQEPLPDEARSTKRWHILDQALQDGPVHRINVAVAIVRAGISQVLNRRWVKDDTDELWQTLTRVEYWNPRDRAPDFVTLGDRDRPAMPPQVRGKLPVIEGRHDGQFQLAVPIGKWGNLVVAEREQIETLQGIATLFKTYLEDGYQDNNGKEQPRHQVPLSIAVFGPPGSGKSFTVKEIAQSLCYKEEEIREFNVAQFRETSDLDRVFSRVWEDYQKYKKGTNKRPPFVFFDEFDCTLGSDELGWLKYFLAPMQDGSIGTETTQKIKRAIFVFAGGVHTSFDEFDPHVDFSTEALAYQVSEEYRKEVKKFADRKGPDFISRLRGHIDIPEANAEPGHAKHFLRRAIQLRGLLEGKLHFITKEGKAQVDEALIYALLTVDRYRHGVRSMEAVLRMCTPHDHGDKHLHTTSLPERRQLNMHIDAEKFYVRLQRGRARMEARSSGSA